jgi:hypothetical protein
VYFSQDFGMIELANRWDWRAKWMGSCAVLACVLAGCSGDRLESQVSGVVTLDGQPIGPGTVVFAPADGGPPATGSVGEDGRYTLKTSRAEGLAAGTYRVALSIRKIPENFNPADRLPPGESLIPEKYEQSSTSGLEFEVSPGNNTIDLPLTSQ